MFVNIIVFPLVKDDDEFRRWFDRTNADYARFDGFIRRRLLRPRDAGPYVAVVEHESYDTFMAMHTSPVQAEASERVMPLLDGRPTPTFYEVVLDSVTVSTAGSA